MVNQYAGDPDVGRLQHNRLINNGGGASFLFFLVVFVIVMNKVNVHCVVMTSRDSPYPY